MTKNKAREVNSPLIKQLIHETSPEELAKIEAYADAYANGYTAGYERALQLIKWQIEHLLPSSKESINTQI